MPVVIRLDLLVVAWVTLFSLVAVGFTTGALFAWVIVPTPSPVVAAILALAGGWLGIIVALFTAHLVLYGTVALYARWSGGDDE